MKRKISIILPVYNSEKFINDCILSILKQTYSYFELIIVNDGSTDNSKKEVEKFLLDKRIIFLEQENKGISEARNAGLKKANGDYLFFVDSDDMLLPNCLEKCIYEMQSGNYDVVICDYYTSVPRYKKTSIKFSFNDLIFEFSKSDRIQNFCWGKLFDRKIWGDTRFINGRCFEDIFAVTDVFCKCKKGGCFIEDQLYFYRKRIDSESKCLDYKKLNDFCDALLYKYDCLNNISHDISMAMVESFFQYKSLLLQLHIKEKYIFNRRKMNLVFNLISKHKYFKHKYLFIKIPLLPRFYFCIKKDKTICFSNICQVKNYELNKIKQIEFDIFKHTIEFIEKKHLRYFCVGGTALGACKYGGFIPWDDDIDIAMPREDFEIFKNTFIDDDDYFIQSNNRDKKYPLNVVKIRKKGTSFIEFSTSKLKIKDGVFIDVFPIDYFLKEKLPLIYKIRNLKIFSYVLEKDAIPSLKKLIYRTLSLFIPGSRNFLSKKNDLLFSRLNNETNAEFCYIRTIFVPSYFFKNNDYCFFNGLKVKMPFDYKKYLNLCYGDIKLDPDIQKQVPHHFLIYFNFGE